ncbi:MAG: topoisomerase DNA-binding C4 zinc finger domain-containing protein, partial [Firmicutes bacterium]|nr:topoisomerase DNA-binding C4 zinc finger domain-containing protein [Bacillota bacterium]
YAPIVETILERGYVIREEKRFVPTELGEVVVELLKEHFPSVIDVDFTARMENRLDDVEDGKQDWKDLLRDFYNPFAQLIDRAEEQIGKVEIAPEVTDEICEHCGRNLVVKHGRYGKFLACPGFPECRFTKPIVESVGVNCPDCGGDIVVRRSKKGRRFYGCANYPTCSFVSWNKPTGQKCPRCETFLVESAARGRKASLKCANSGCGYTTAPAGSAGSARSPGGARK